MDRIQNKHRNAGTKRLAGNSILFLVSARGGIIFGSVFLNASWCDSTTGIANPRCLSALVTFSLALQEETETPRLHLFSQVTS